MPYPYRLFLNKIVNEIENIPKIIIKYQKNDKTIIESSRIHGGDCFDILNL